MKIKQIEWEHNPDFKVCKRYEAKLAFGTFASIMYFGKGWEWKIKLGLADIAGGVSVSLENAKRGCEAQWERLWKQVVDVNEGCEYCTIPATPLILDEWVHEDIGDVKALLETEICGNKLMTCADIRFEYREGAKEINYCPMCGTKLKEME